MNQTIAPLGVIAFDQAGTATATWDVTAPIAGSTNTNALKKKGGDWTTGCFQLGNITGLTFTVAITIDGVTRNPLMVTDAGTRIASGGTVTASDGLKVYFDYPIGATKVVATATAGSGNIELLLMNDPAALQTAGSSGSSGSVVTVAGFTSDSTLWSKTHVPAENVVATINKTAPGAGTRLVVTHISGFITTDNAAPTAGSRLLTVTEDPAGTPVVLWQAYVGIPATAGATSGVAIPVELAVATNKSVTIAFASAGGVDTLEVVNMNGRVETI